MRRPHLRAAGLLMGLAMCGSAWAQDITAFENGYVTFDNPDTNLYYRVEFRPNLTGPEGWETQLPMNIKTNASAVTVPVGVFYRVAGRDTSWPAIPVPKTGQTNSLYGGDDAWWSTNGIGTAPPDPRFVVQSDTNVVLDTLTGLMWVRNVNLDAEVDLGLKTWYEALDYCNTLDYGGYDDWRLPNVREFLSLIDFGIMGPALPAGHPFTGFDSMDPYTFHWTSSAIPANPDYRWLIKVMTGEIAGWSWAAEYYAWPVRGGQ